MQKYITVALLLISCISFAETPTKEDAQKLATTAGVVYVSMPKEALYKVYAKHQQMGYRKEGNEEWIIFSGLVTEEPEETITFYLKDGKVKGWDGKVFEATYMALDVREFAKHMASYGDTTQFMGKTLWKLAHQISIHEATASEIQLFIDVKSKLEEEIQKQRAFSTPLILQEIQELHVKILSLQKEGIEFLIEMFTDTDKDKNELELKAAEKIEEARILMKLDIELTRKIFNEHGIKLPSTE